MKPESERERQNSNRKSGGGMVKELYFTPGWLGKYIR